MKSIWLSLDYLLELSWRADAKLSQYVTGEINMMFCNYY